MAKVTTRKKKRTTDSRTRCVTTRCCVECPRPTRRRRRRKLASRSLPLSRAMPMPLPSLMNIMPSPFMPLNVPLPRVEANRRPFGTYQMNNQPLRVQQKSTRTIGTITDNMVRGTTSQKLPITNPPRPTLMRPPRILRPVAMPPPPRRSQPNLKRFDSDETRIGTPPDIPITPPNPFDPPNMSSKMSRTPPNPFDPPNILDIGGLNSVGFSNQGQNLRNNLGVRVARNELITAVQKDPFSNLKPFENFQNLSTPQMEEEKEDLSPSLISGPVGLSMIRRDSGEKRDPDYPDFSSPYSQSTYVPSLGTLRTASGGSMTAVDTATSYV